MGWIFDHPNGRGSSPLDRSQFAPTSSARSAGHLRVFAGLEESEPGSVVLLQRIVDDGSGRHIHAHRECFRREKNLHQTWNDQPFVDEYERRAETENDA